MQSCLVMQQRMASSPTPKLLVNPPSFLPNPPTSPSVTSPRNEQKLPTLSTHAKPGSSNSLLKRKRPPKLSIPVLECSPQVAHKQEALSSHTHGGDGYGVSCKRGRRQIMEDAFTAVPNLNSTSNQAFYGVFDGHGGREAAEFASRNLLRNILDACSDNSKPRPGSDEIRVGYHTTDCDFLQEGSSSGASCVTALIDRDRLIVANAGDCRAVLVKSGGTAVQLTQDHRVSCELERERIEQLGGVVDCYTGTWRVHGVLAVSRGIGDMNFKQFISCEPDITTFQLTDDSEFLILASDGLWDVVSNQEAVECGLRILRKGESSNKHTWRRCSSEDLAAACKQLVNMSLQRGCLDDVTVMIIELQSFRN